jgi:hypothetical protein
MPAADYFDTLKISPTALMPFRYAAIARWLPYFRHYFDAAFSAASFRFRFSFSLSILLRLFAVFIFYADIAAAILLS